MMCSSKDLKDNIKEHYVALGAFDGLHLGHLKLIKKAIKRAVENDCKSIVYTFQNHPLTTIKKEMAPKLLMDNETKEEYLKEIGIDKLELVNFDEALMKTSCEEFILNLIKAYNIKGIIVGFNFRFGYKNYGDTNLLKQLSEKYNFDLCVQEEVKYENEIISSSRIRQLIREGKVLDANKMLYKPFFIKGEVISGNQIGKTIDFPTANISYSSKSIIPSNGVYYTNVKIDNKIYKGITNIGFNPTVTDFRDLSIETHILDFNEDIYGKCIKVCFLDRIRDERKFENLNKLKEQLHKDKEFAESKNVSSF